MSSKTLLFNRALFKKDIKLVMWFAAFVGGILFFDLPMSNSRFLDATKAVDPTQASYAYGTMLITQALKRQTVLQIIWLFFFPMLTAAILIGEERRKKTFDLLSVMPYTRAQIFFNKVLAGISVMLIPYVINFMIMVFMRSILSGVQHVYSYWDIAVWLWMSSATLILFFSFTMLIGTFVGGTISQIILTVIFAILPFSFWALFYTNLEYISRIANLNLFRFTDEALKYITLPYYISPETFTGTEISSRTFGITLMMLAASMVMLVFSNWLFGKNKMERNGEILMFGKLETFFKVGTAVCAMLILGPIMVYMLNNSIIGLCIGYALGLAIGWFVPHFFIQFNRAKA